MLNEAQQPELISTSRLLSSHSQRTHFPPGNIVHHKASIAAAAHAGATREATAGSLGRVAYRKAPATNTTTSLRAHQTCGVRTIAQGRQWDESPHVHTGSVSASQKIGAAIRIQTTSTIMQDDDVRIRWRCDVASMHLQVAFENAQDFQLRRPHLHRCAPNYYTPKCSILTHIA